MNYSLNPPKGGAKTDSSNYLDSIAGSGNMADIMAMMKKQGINLDGFEAEAEDIWKSLDTMSMNDPDEYRKFIENQYKESQEEDEKSQKAAANPTAKGASSKAPEKTEEEDRFFRPIAGFSIKTKTSDGDGLKVRAEGDGKDLYINFCSHPAIEAPLDRNGRAVDMRDFYRTRPPDGLQIPLVLGPLRDVNATTLAVDAVFNLKVIDCCEDAPDSPNKGKAVSGDKEMALFKQQIIELATDWVVRDTGVVFSKVWFPCGDRYSGGRGNDKLTPVLFSVTHATEQSNNRRDEDKVLITGKKSSVSNSNFLSGGDLTQTQTVKGKPQGAIQSPSSLLSAMRVNSISEKDAAEEGISMSINRESDKKKPTSSTSNNNITSSSDGNNSNVNSSSSGNNPPKPPPSIKKGFLDSATLKDRPIYPDTGSAEGTGGAKGGSLARVMDKCRVINMADMTSMAPANPNPVKPVINSSSSNIASSSPSSSSSKTKENQKEGQEVLTIDNMLYEGTDCTYKDVITEGVPSLSVTLTGIDSSLFDTQTLDLQVSLDQILILLNTKGGTKGVRALRLIGFQKKLNRATAKAKLSGKKKTLTITVEYC